MFFSYFQENTLWGFFFDILLTSKTNTKFETFYICELLTAALLRLFYVMLQHVICDL